MEMLILLLIGFVVLGCLFGFITFFVMINMRRQIRGLENKVDDMSSMQWKLKDLEKKLEKSALEPHVATPASKPEESKPVVAESSVHPPEVIPQASAATPSAPPVVTPQSVIISESILSSQPEKESVEKTSEKKEEIKIVTPQPAYSVKTPEEEVSQKPSDENLKGKKDLSYTFVKDAGESKTESRPASTPEFIKEKKPLSEYAPASSETESSFSLEKTLGEKWLVWVGVLFIVIASAFFLKYAYDKKWFGVIGPTGRLAIGACVGITCIIFGDHFRRKNWAVLFQSLTGGGIAILYSCVFFSFKMYQLMNQTPSFIMAVIVTLFALAMAVSYNAISIAVIAMIGGFLSPVLLSTGENHPHIFFSYIMILNFLTIGAAYFKRWREIDVFAFLATVAMYLGWYNKFYGKVSPTDQMFPALLYLGVFYLVFLIVPTIHSMIRRTSNPQENVVLIIANTVFSFANLYRILYPQYNTYLAMAVIIQALIVFILFKTYLIRLPKDHYTSESLLIVGLGLVTIAIPVKLSMYGIPIAWALESAMLMYLSCKFNRATLRFGGSIALALACYGLFRNLPLHTKYFNPIINPAFGSWLLVSASAFFSYYILAKKSAEIKTSPQSSIEASSIMKELSESIPASLISGFSYIIGFAVFALLISMEAWLTWDIDLNSINGWKNHACITLIIIW